jgi:hypothetical protein
MREGCEVSQLLASPGLPIWCSYQDFPWGVPEEGSSGLRYDAVQNRDVPQKA